MKSDFILMAINKQFEIAGVDATILLEENWSNKYALTYDEYLEFREWFNKEHSKLSYFNSRRILAKNWSMFYDLYGFNVLQIKTNGDEII